MAGRTKFQNPGRGALLTGKRQPGRGGEGTWVCSGEGDAAECGEGSSPKPSPRGNFAATVSKDGRRPSSGTGFCAEWEPRGRRQLLSPHGYLSGAWGQSRAGGTESGFARLGWRISLPLAGRSAGQERGSPLLFARAGPPGPGLFRRGVTEAGKRKRRRQPSAARDGGRGLRVAFKVSRNPSAAGGDWRSARGFLGALASPLLLPLQISYSGLLTLLWPPEAPCAAALRAGREPTRVSSPLTMQG